MLSWLKNKVAQKQMAQATGEFTVGYIAQKLGAKVEGDADFMIHGISTLEAARPDQVTFLCNPKYNDLLPETKAGAVIVAPDMVASCPSNAIVLENPYLGLAKVAELFSIKPKAKAVIHKTATIGQNCQIADNVSIGPNCAIGDGVVIEKDVIIGANTVISDVCKIGEGTEFKPNVTVYHDVKIGKRCVFHSGVVLGSDGFGLANENGKWVKIAQVGGVTIHDDVEIGANTTVDRGAMEDTVIHEGVKIDNQVQVAHNVVVGAHSAIAAQAGIAGSAKIGQYCMLGGGSGVTGHIQVGDKIILTAQSAFSKTTLEEGIYSSSIPARPMRVWQKELARLRQIEKLTKRVKQLERALENGN